MTIKTQRKKWKHKNERYKFARSDFEAMRTFFKMLDWKEMNNATSIPKKYEFFYKEGVTKHISIIS